MHPLHSVLCVFCRQQITLHGAMAELSLSKRLLEDHTHTQEERGHVHYCQCTQYLTAQCRITLVWSGTKSIECDRNSTAHTRERHLLSLYSAAIGKLLGDTHNAQLNYPQICINFHTYTKGFTMPNAPSMESETRAPLSGKKESASLYRGRHSPSCPKLRYFCRLSP